MTERMRCRPGVTLLELLLVLAILGILSAVAGLRLAAIPRATEDDPARAALAAARADAIRSGRVVTIELEAPHAPLRATATPDGAILHEGDAGVERFSGRSRR
jgi:prepilin-type N-terminal cleavage/methylation domain-containing protein